jgi:hypothetical protein
MSAATKKITPLEARQLADSLFAQGQDFEHVRDTLKANGLDSFDAIQTAIVARDSKERVSNTPKEEMKAAVIEAPVSVPVNLPVAPPALKQVAERCIERGWYIFPLGVKSKVTDAALAPHSHKSASNDIEQIRAWWTASPHANIGIDLGRSNLTVLDFDKGLPPAELGLQDAFQVRTSRGTHVYFAGKTDQSKMVLNGETIGDIKSAGGYILSPHSVHPDGPVYTVASAANITPILEGLIERLRPIREKVDASLTGARIPHGQHDDTLFRIGCKLRQLGLEEEGIYSHLVEVCEKRCENYGSDYKEMCRAKAQQACKYPAGVDGTLIMSAQAPVAATQIADVTDWRSMFRSVDEMDDGPIDMIIEGVLQEGTCFIGANPGDGKTLVGLAFAKAISTGQPLFGLPEFSVKEPRTVIYLIPESRDRAFRKRCEAFQLPKDKMKFMARTISCGVCLELSDPYLLEAVRQTKPVIFLDTASRFMKSTDENAAAQNRMLVNDVISLLAAGAVAVVIVHHATKAAKQNQERMSLENMLRGTSDFGAMCDQAYGIRKDMTLYASGSGPMEIDLESLKDRELVGGLTRLRLAASHKNKGELIPISHINETGDFRVVNNTEAIRRNVEALVTLVKGNKSITVEDLATQTGLTAYAVRHELVSLGWHRVQGGPGGASPWHQDNGAPCPYKKLDIGDAVAYLKNELAGTEPGGQYTGVLEADIFQGADERGLPDALITKAKKRLGIVVDKKTKEWSLPDEPEGSESEPTVN